ncbi:membrane protein [Bifidobacterium actinocoloniiforme DSM 22766]|nr:membrane protein [Bifidobacterium actinocoloniiforme DSM 22766]
MPGGPQRSRDPFRLIVEDLTSKSVNLVRAVFGIVGAVALIIGLALLIVPGKTLTVFTVALGVYFIITGLVHLITSIVAQGLPGGWRVLSVLIGALLAIGGVVIVKNTTVSASTLLVLVTLIVGIGWIMEGVMTLAESWAVPHSGWAIFSAVVSIIAGVFILINPMGSTVVLVIFGACALVVLGVASLIRAFTFGRRR